MTHEVHTYCRVCDPACGLVATVSDDRLVHLGPDREHPVSQGFACPRGLAGVEINHDPDRLNFPLERVGDELVRRHWDVAIGDVATRLSDIIRRDGPKAVGCYIGNPASYNSQLGMSAPEVLRRLGVERTFGSSTQDCNNKFAASAAVYGTTALHPLPDFRNADALLLLGSNWRTSKGSFISLPSAYRELLAAAARGTKIWFVNPRHTESAGELTGDTVPIKPDTDVYFLAALINEIDRTTGFSPNVEGRGRHIEGLRNFVRAYPVERVAPICGIPEEDIRDIAHRFGTARRAAAHMSTGVNMGRQGTLAYWLMQMLVFVTGNLDEIGGNIPGREFYPAASKARTNFDDGFTEGDFGATWRGHLPGVLLADYILDAAVPIRALVVIAGNPLLSIPGEARLREALSSLELLVVVDIYSNASSEYAHWLLPATDQFEREDYNIALLGMQPDAFLQWTPRVVEPQFERREEWWMFARLSQALGLPSVLDDADPTESRWGKIDHMLSKGGLLRSEVKASTRGVPLLEGGLEPGHLFNELIQTPDGRIDCCPNGFQQALERCASIFDGLAAEDPHQLRLITRRHSQMQNSWYANVPAMKKGRRDRNRLSMNPVDAQRLEVADGCTVTVRSSFGELIVTAEVDENLREGVVSLEHGWGLQQGMRLSRERPGVNVNVLMPNGPGTFEPLSNQAQLTGIPVTVVVAEMAEP